MMLVVLMLEDLATVGARAFVVQPRVFVRRLGLPATEGAYLMAF
jgi:hypothetical protein